MKKKRSLRRSDRFWAGLALLLVLLQFWWLPGEDGSAADSWSVTVDGKLAGVFKSSGLRPHFMPRAAYYGLDKVLMEAMG